MKRHFLLPLLLAALLCLTACGAHAPEGKEPEPIPVEAQAAGESRGDGPREEPREPQEENPEENPPAPPAESQGWTLTLDKVTADPNFATLVVTMTAPEGTALDADNYTLDCMPLVGESGGGFSVDLLEDDNPTDNRVSFSVEMALHSGGPREGILYVTSLEGVYYTEGHVGESFFPVVTGDWSVPFRLEAEGDVLTYQLDKEISTHLGKLVVGRVEVGPLSALITLSGDTSAVEGVEAAYPGASVRSDRILLKLLDQSGERVLPGMSTYSRGQGGGWELLLSFDSAIRPEALASIDIDGAEVPLRADS